MSALLRATRPADPSPHRADAYPSRLWPKLPFRRAAIPAACACMLSLLWPVGVQSQLRDAGWLDQRAQQEAIANIPFDRLSEAAQAKLSAVLAQPTIYRRLPVTIIDSDPDLYLFLIRHPEVIVNMWDLMGVTKVQIQRTGDFTFDASDGAGTGSHLELIYGDRETHVLFGEGAYEGPLFRRLVRGRCVGVLKSNYQQTLDQRVYISNQLDIFLQLDNVGGELLAKTLHPLVGKSADHNFVESSRFLGQVAQASESKPAKMQELATRLKKVEPQVRGQFASLVVLVGQRAAMRGGWQGGEETWQGLQAADSRQVEVEQLQTDPSPHDDKLPGDAAANSRKPLRLRR